MPTFFSGHYLRNHSTLDIGVLGYNDIVQHKEHSLEVLSIPPGTPCINSTNIPPIMIINRIYEHQNLLYVVPLMRHTIVCISSISPMAIGCFICININLVFILIDISNFVMSGGILFEMLVLGINEILFAFPQKF